MKNPNDQSDATAQSDDGKQKPTRPQLSADSPVSHPNDDRLGYAPFAKQIVRGIVHMAPPEGLVIGLYGRWGLGKTTILHLVEHYIEEDLEEKECPIVVRFNPWWFSSQADLVAKFFLQLELSIRKRISSKELANQLSDEMATFAASIGQASESPVSEGEVAQAALEKPISGDIPFLKEQIANTLLKSGHRILVIVDDIDRLATAAEIRQVFQAIKAVADFPGIVYLLAFDKEVVVGALDQERMKPGFGNDYLEKIVQVPFEMPLLDPIDVQQMLFEQLDIALAGTPEKLFSKDYWQDIFYQGVSDFIQTPRDAVRLANTIQLTYSIVCGEVNPVDFIAIEALRVFEPAVYDTIRYNSNMFAGHAGGISSIGSNPRESLQKFHDEWLTTKVSTYRQDVVKSLVIQLFPKLKYAWENSGYGAEWESAWRRELRICSPEIFPTYFRLTIPKGSIPQTLMQGILALTGDADLMADALRKMTGQFSSPNTVSTTRKVLKRLLDHVDKDLPTERIASLLTALYDVGDEIAAAEPKTTGFYDFDISVDIGRIFFSKLFADYPNQKDSNSSARYSLLVQQLI